MRVLPKKCDEGEQGRRQTGLHHEEYIADERNEHRDSTVKIATASWLGGAISSGRDRTEQLGCLGLVGVHRPPVRRRVEPVVQQRRIGPGVQQGADTLQVPVPVRLVQ